MSQITKEHERELAPAGELSRRPKGIRNKYMKRKETLANEHERDTRASGV